jgi:hypothetical protein
VYNYTHIKGKNLKKNTPWIANETVEATDFPELHFVCKGKQFLDKLYG